MASPFGTILDMGCPALLAIFWREGGPLDINEYLYLGNQRVARALNFGSSYYYYADYLGTSRASADENGNKCYDADYFPWGGEQYVFTNTCSQNYKFTGKERDPDMGIDDFGARFYKNTMARFYSPDWSATVEPVPYARLNNPQSLNLYTYVLDNPLSFRDADGHELGADTLQEVQKITSDSGNAAQSNGVDGKTIGKGVGEVGVGGGLITLTILLAPETGCGSLAALGIFMGVMGGEAEIGKGTIDIAKGSGAIGDKSAEEGKQGVDLATNSVSAAVLPFTSPKTAGNIGSVANGAMGLHDLAKRPENFKDALNKLSSARDVKEGYQSAKQLLHQADTWLMNKAMSLTPYF